MPARSTLVSPNRPARTAVTLPPELRRHRLGVMRWALANGRPLNLDAITLILAVRSFEQRLDRRPFLQWTGPSVMTFLWASTIEWCDQHDVALAENMAETLWTYFDSLHDRDAFASGSDGVGLLRSALQEHGGLGPDGRQHRRGPKVPRTGSTRVPQPRRFDPVRRTH